MIDGETIVRRTVQCMDSTIIPSSTRVSTGRGRWSIWLRNTTTAAIHLDPESENAVRLEEFRQKMKDRVWLRGLFEESYGSGA